MNQIVKCKKRKTTLEGNMAKFFNNFRLRKAFLTELKIHKLTKINGKISCVHGLEELIFLNVHTTQSHLDSIQSLSRLQWHFLKE